MWPALSERLKTPGLTDEASTGRCGNPRKGHYLNDNNPEHLKTKISECFAVHYNHSVLTIRAAADGSGEQSGTGRPRGSSNGSSRITVWVILQNIIKSADMTSAACLSSTHL
jgi:hypothetical protein